MKEFKKLTAYDENEQTTASNSTTPLFDLSDVIVSLRTCHFKSNEDGELSLVRESKSGLKYLIFADDGISFAHVKNEAGKFELIAFDGANAKELVERWSNEL